MQRAELAPALDDRAPHPVPTGRGAWAFAAPHKTPHRMPLRGRPARWRVHALEPPGDGGGIETPPQRGARLGGEPAAARRVRELAERPSELTRIGLDQAPGPGARDDVRYAAAVARGDDRDAQHQRFGRGEPEPLAAPRNGERAG